MLSDIINCVGIFLLIDFPFRMVLKSVSRHLISTLDEKFVGLDECSKCVLAFASYVFLVMKSRYMVPFLYPI